MMSKWSRLTLMSDFNGRLGLVAKREQLELFTGANEHLVL